MPLKRGAGVPPFTVPSRIEPTPRGAAARNLKSLTAAVPCVGLTELTAASFAAAEQLRESPRGKRGERRRLPPRRLISAVHGHADARVGSRGRVCWSSDCRNGAWHTEPWRRAVDF